jgi:hypothetical protein
MLAIQAGNSTSDSLGIDTAHSSRGGQRRTARRAGEPTQTTTIWRPANTIFLAIDDRVSARKAAAFTVINDMSCGHWLA